MAKRWPAVNLSLPEMAEAKYRGLALLAFNQLEHRLKGVSRIDLRELGGSEVSELPSSAPLFVTWQLNGRLRGCIGTFKAHKLERGVRDFADSAAFEDPRFPPISTRELPNLDVCVTLLGPLEPIQSPTDWEIGIHGLRAEFPGGYSSTYLPEVAEEQGWDHAETIESLADKAGASSTKGVKLWKYEGVKTRLTYPEYQLLLKQLS